MKPTLKKRSKRLRKTQRMRGGDDLKSAGIAAISSIINFKSIEEQIFDYIKNPPVSGGYTRFYYPGTRTKYIFTISDDKRGVDVANESTSDIKARIYTIPFGHP